MKAKLLGLLLASMTMTLHAMEPDDSNNSLLKATSANDMEAFLKLVPNFSNLNINKKDDRDEIALYHATCKKNLEMVKILLEHGADVNVRKQNFKHTVLMLAAEIGFTPVVKILLAVPGIEINAKNNKHDTALSLAAARGHFHVVKALLAMPGIELNIVNGHKRTALKEAQDNFNSHILDLLLAAGAEE